MNADCYGMGYVAIEVNGSKKLPHTHAYCKAMQSQFAQEQLEKSLAVLIHENSLFHSSTVRH